MRTVQLTPEQQEKGCYALGVGLGIAGAWTIGGLLLATGLWGPAALAAGAWYLTRDNGSGEKKEAAPPNGEIDRPQNIQPW